MAVYYNDNDRTCAAWLQELIREGLIPEGDVDDRSIHNVKAKDLKGYTQAHFFAGIGGWAYALQLAGWAPDEPVWTGSCPCQPYSVAGKGAGDDDPRNLWPVWRELILQCRPATVFGEQVASKDGRKWLAGVRADLEAMGYVVGVADLCAAGVGAPHIRQRLWWVAHTHTQRNRLQGRALEGSHQGRQAVPSKQLPRLLQSHSWPTLSDSLVWARTHGVPRDVGVAKANIAIGNSIVPQVAAEFVKAYMEA